MARLARIGTRGADERWCLLGELHWHALAMLSQVAQKLVQGLQQGGRRLRLKSKTQRKLRELDAAWGILRHLTLQKSEDFLAQLAAELELEGGEEPGGQTAAPRPAAPAPAPAAAPAPRQGDYETTAAAGGLPPTAPPPEAATSAAPEPAQGEEEPATPSALEPTGLDRRCLTVMARQGDALQRPAVQTLPGRSALRSATHEGAGHAQGDTEVPPLQLSRGEWAEWKRWAARELELEGLRGKPAASSGCRGNSSFFPP